METREILEKLKKGELSLEEAEGALRRQPFDDEFLGMPSWIPTGRYAPVSRKSYFVPEKQMRIFLRSLAGCMRKKGKSLAPGHPGNNMN